MSPTRRQVVNAIAAGAVVPVTVASAEAQEQDSQDFSPDITIHSNNLVATIGARDDDVDPDTVAITTADGVTHEFDGAAQEEWNAGMEFDVGYTNGASRARIEGSWHGVIREVTATRGDESVTETNDRASSLEVSCSMWQTPDEPPRQFAVVSEGATKHHWNRGNYDLSEDQRQYGSPGRPLQTVVEHNSEVEMQVDFQGCSPSSQKALRFNCTSVTVEEEELNQGEDRIEDVYLEFTDGSSESPPGTADDADNGAYELPVTLEGTGDNAGKVIERLAFKVDGGEYSYTNLDSENCSPETSSQQETQENDGSDEQQNETDATADDSTESDSTSDDNTNDSSTSDDNTNDSSTSDDNTNNESTIDSSTSSDESTRGSQSSGSTGGQDSTNGGSTSGGSSDSGTSSRSSSGGSTGSDLSADGTATPTPDSDTSTVSVNKTEEEHIQLNTSSTPENTTPTNASRTNAVAEASNEPATTTTSELTDAASAEDQPGLGFVSGLGGLLGFGELARRRLGRDEDEE